MFNNTVISNPANVLCPWEIGTYLINRLIATCSGYNCRCKVLWLLQTPWRLMLKTFLYFLLSRRVKNQNKRKNLDCYFYERKRIFTVRVFKKRSSVLHWKRMAIIISESIRLPCTKYFSFQFFFFCALFQSYNGLEQSLWVSCLVRFF